MDLVTGSHIAFSLLELTGGERERELCLLSCLLTRRPGLLDQSLTFTVSFYCLLQGSITRYSHMQTQASTCALEREELVQSITPVHMDIWCKELTHWKDPDAGKDWGQEEKGTTEDEMVGWHHRLNGHGFDLTLGVVDGQGGLLCCSPWGHKEADTTEQHGYLCCVLFCLHSLTSGLQRFISIPHTKYIHSVLRPQKFQTIPESIQSPKFHQLSSPKYHHQWVMSKTLGVLYPGAEFITTVNLWN